MDQVAAPAPSAEFDNYAVNYDAGMGNPLKRLLGASAEDYLRMKIDWMMRDLCRRPVAAAGSAPPRLLDYGCGHGLFLRVLAERGFSGELTGCDVSTQMLRQAEQCWQTDRPCDFFRLDPERPAHAVKSFDVIVLCAVLHHILPAERRATYEQANAWLKPGGRIYVFEHNPFNPLTCWVVKRTPIDQHAILLRAREVNIALAQAGFTGLATDYQMFFPPRLRFLNRLEGLLRWLPLGGQYAVRGEKPQPV